MASFESRIPGIEIAVGWIAGSALVLQLATWLPRLPWHDCTRKVVVEDDGAITQTPPRDQSTSVFWTNRRIIY